MLITKEEKLMVLVAKISLAQSGEMTARITPQAVIKGLCIRENSFWNMFNGLARANFLKKEGGEIWLTPQGIELIERLIPLHPNLQLDLPLR